MRPSLNFHAVLLTGLLVCAAAQHATAAQAQDVMPTRGQDAAPNAPPTSQAAANPQRIRVGGNVMQAALVHQVMPVYPEVAKTAHIEGTVALHAIVAKDGTVQELQYVSGHPLLMRPAMDAVRQWVYKPTLLNGQPVEVDTTISVVFKLGGSTPSQDAAPTDVDPQLRADILHMLEVNHAIDKAQDAMRAMFDTLRPQVSVSLPPTPNRDKIVDAYLDKLVALAHSPKFTEGIVTVYAKYFSDDDIKALTEFYQTPAGQHFNDHMSDIMGDSMRFGQQLFTQNMNGIFAELCKEYPELQGQAKFCPSSGEKQSDLLRPTDKASDSGTFDPFN